MKSLLWKADLENGRFRNPILYADYSDPDVIRVGSTYYMTASSFQFTPGLPILTSMDLVNWKLVNYAVENIPYKSYDLAAHARGIWAPALRYHEGQFYIYYGMPDEGIFMVRASDACQTFSEPVLVLEGKGMIDPCPLWDGNGKAYIVHGYAKSRIGFNSILGMFPMSWDGTKAVGEDHFIFDGRKTQVTIEGPKIYRRGQWYYIFAPAGGVKNGWQTVLRSKQIHGPYEEKIVMTQGGTDINGPHQGGLVDSEDGREWFLHFQDRGVYGRIPHLQPVFWQESGWPVIGEDLGENGWGQPCLEYDKPRNMLSQVPDYLEASDDFDGETPGLMWQWSGNHHQSFWSMADHHPGLRLYGICAKGARQQETGLLQRLPLLWDCPNLLTQKIICPEFEAETVADTGWLKQGCLTGLILLGGQYAYLGVLKKENKDILVYVHSEGEHEKKKEKVIWQKELPAVSSGGSGRYKLTIRFFHQDQPVVMFGYALEGEKTVWMRQTFLPASHTWVGARAGLFCIAPKQEETPGWAEYSHWNLISLNSESESESESRKQEAKESETPPGFLAARSGNLEQVRQIVEYSKTSMNQKGPGNTTILHEAAVSGNLELVRYLVERVGLSPMEGDKNLITPFDIAVEQGSLPVIRYFEQICGGTLDSMYRNPIRTGMFPDPSVVRVGEDYYMVNSSFIFFPCIPISHSKDLIHWKIIGHAITNGEWAGLDELEGGRGYWAPDISFNQGYFYITATYRMNDEGSQCRRQMVTRSAHAQGPYSKPIFIEEDGIDPSLFWEENGRCYMLLNRGARIFELSKDASSKISEAKLLYYGDQKCAPEGPHLLKKDGYYYLFLAEGGTGMGHRITVSRSETLMGVYQPCPYNPIMHQTNPSAGIQRCGHGKPVMTQNGQWYMVYLCGRALNGKYSVLGRETALDEITWTLDGWPLVHRLCGPSVLEKKPNLKEWKWDSLPIDWAFPRPPESDGYRFTEGKLLLKGSKAPLHTIEAKNIALRRQTAFNFTADTILSLEGPMWPGPGQSAGMICYYDENTWLTFGVTGEECGRLLLSVKEHIGEEDRETTGIFLTKETWENEDQIVSSPLYLYLKIDTIGLRRCFQWRLKGEERWHRCADLWWVDYLCEEGYSKGKRFTGAMYGLFAYAGEIPYTAEFLKV